MFDEYTDSDDELDQEDGFNGSSNPSSFFARGLEKKNKSDAIKAAEAKGDAITLKGLILKSALREAQCTAVDYFRSYFDISVTTNSPEHPLLGDLRVLALEIETAYPSEQNGLNLVAGTIRQYTYNYVDPLTTANNMPAHSSLNS